MATTDPKPGTCMVRIYDDRSSWHYSTREKFCGRPVKGQGAISGADLCGVHLRGEQQRKDRDDATEARYRRSSSLTDRLGIGVSAITHGPKEGMVAVYPQSLANLADRMDLLRDALRVITEDPTISSWLADNDPMALAQAINALDGKAGRVVAS